LSFAYFDVLFAADVANLQLFNWQINVKFPHWLGFHLCWVLQAKNNKVAVQAEKVDPRRR